MHIVLLAAALVAPTVHASNFPDDVIVPPVYETAVAMPCLEDMDCRNFPWASICDPELEECVECFDPMHCDPGWTCTPAGSCADACQTSTDCDGVGGRQLCDRDEGLCVECLGPDDCLREEYCSVAGQCSRDVCTPGESFCGLDGLRLCLEDDGTSRVMEDCTEGCEMTEAGAQCVGASTGSGSATSTAGTAGNSGADSGGSGAAVTSGGSSATTPGASPTDPSVDGCSCRSDSNDDGWLSLLLVALGSLRRRRKKGPAAEV
ncbi:MAG: MYXO-CTERM sorting domain-containing protein [Deltaproteobacteria bacterium]|nr:MYXO-CTERM sorting domain-containing protein [Deltaproteobacteria bacterium]